MERLLTLRLQAWGCRAEASLNDIPLARVGPQRPLACVPVHEFTLSGANHLRLVIEPFPPGVAGAALPPPALHVSDGQVAAHLRLLLPRIGHAANERNARTLGALDFAPAAGERYQTPRSLQAEVMLPVSFPRWRFVDAPVVPSDAALSTKALGFAQELALALAGGNADAFVQAARLRFEELALAYQRPVADDIARFCAEIERLYAAKALAIAPPQADAFVLRRCANGRLLECLDSKARPALRSAAASDGIERAWPLRLGVVEERFYVLR